MWQLAYVVRRGVWRGVHIAAAGIGGQATVQEQARTPTLSFFPPSLPSLLPTYQALTQKELASLAEQLAAAKQKHDKELKELAKKHERDQEAYVEKTCKVSAAGCGCGELWLAGG